MKYLVTIVIALLFSVAGFAENSKLKDLELRFDKRMPSQVTGDFGRQFASQLVTEDCSKETALRVYGASKSEDDLRKSFFAEAGGIVKEFSALMQYEYSGHNQCGEEANTAANSLIKRGNCLMVFAAKGYKLAELQNMDGYKKASKRYAELISNKEKIDGFNMPMVDDNSCAKQGKQTYLTLIKVRASSSLKLALFLNGNY